ncbi:hypothetical protein [Sediminibacterium ginsengisoli]|uniref:Uncharacterized protein n=1 Tax=Sediminibacterium ginsengisoli TaxID=413434 RepID=A0A1T4PMD1_9BACT|nr:hypothetical protein [Sediminibacterium ginsengisoli]SJZ92511.1 hypothetical protein SAMN04488132_10685 [Sediminibacterium ginsengisoli]
MNSRFESLFSVQFAHDYTGGEYHAFSFSPTPETSRDLQRMGLVFKARRDGFSVVYDTIFAGDKREKLALLKEDLVLVLNIANADPDFYIYTAGLDGDPGKIPGRSLFCFTNEAAAGESPRHQLHEQDFVSERDIITLEDYPETFFVKPFGQCRIRMHEELAGQFVVRFAAKSTYWRYLLVSEHLKELDSPAVINKDTGEVFAGPEIITLPDQRSAIAFRSVQPIILTSKPNRSFQLVANYDAATGRYRVVKNLLPNPLPGAISAVASSEDEKLIFSEIFL